MTVENAAPPEPTTGATVVRGGLWTLVSKLLPQAFVAVVSIAAARFLGPQLFGRQSFIAFTEVSVIYLLSGGLPLAVSRYVGLSLGADQPGLIRPLAAAALRLTAAAAIVGGAGLAAVGLGGATPRAAWVLAGAVAVVSVLQRLPSAVLIGAQHWRAATMPGLATGAAGTAAVLAVLAAGGGITGMFAVEAAVGLALLLWLGAAARRYVATTPKAAAEAAPTREMLRYAAVTSVTVVLTFVVWRRTEFFFLDHYSSDAEIGYYAIGFSAVAVLGVLPDAIGNALLPAVANLHGARATERIATGYARILRLLLTAAFPLTAAAFAVGPALVQLVYGDSYKRAGTVLLVLVAPFPILGIMNVSNALLAGIGRIIPPVLIGVVATVVNLSLDFLLIPRYDAVGAAVANIAAQLTAAIPVILLASRSAGRIPLATGSLIRIAAAAALGGVAARLTVDALGAQVGVVLGLIVGAAIFAGAVYASRALLREDVEWLRTTPAAPLARVLRPFAGRAR